MKLEPPSTSTGPRPIPVLRVVLCIMLAGMLLAGCAQVRKATYPPGFVYLDEKQVRSQMALMSLYMREIDQMRTPHAREDHPLHLRHIRVAVAKVGGEGEDRHQQLS